MIKQEFLSVLFSEITKILQDNKHSNFEILNGQTTYLIFWDYTNKTCSLYQFKVINNGLVKEKIDFDFIPESLNNRYNNCLISKEELQIWFD